MRSLFLGHLLFGVVFHGLSSEAQTSRATDVKSARSFVYHGKLVRPDGSVPTGSMSVTFKVLSPDPKLCVLWTETQIVELKEGGFSVELGHGVHRLPGASGGAAADFKQAFVNNPGLTISGAQCASGNSYTPSSSDDRLLNATFNDSGNVVQIAGLPIKSVPFALQAEEIGGYGLSNLMKIDDSGSALVYSPAEAQTLKDMLGGNLHFDMKSRGVKNVANPTDPQDAATKAFVESHVANAMVGAGLGTVTNVSVAGGALTITNGTTTPQISLAQASGSNAGYLSATDWNTFNSKQPAGTYVTSVGISVPAYMSSSGGPVTSSGTLALGFSNQAQNSVFAGPNSGGAGAPSFRTLIAADIPALDTSKLASGTLSVARGGTGLAPSMSDANRIYGVDAAGTTAEYKTIIGAGSVTVSHTAGGITITGAAGGGGTVSVVGVGGLPLSVTNATTSPQISIAQANATTAGYLSAADWNTFNGKQPAGSYLTSISGANVVTALGYTPLSQTLAQNQVFLGDGSNLAAQSFFGLGQLRNNLGTAQMPAACGVHQTLVWSAITDVLTCSNINNLDADKITTGTLTVARIPALDAAKIATGTLASARLGSGTADATTYLRGDGTWQPAPAGADHLGNHTATMNLNLAGFNIVGAGEVEVGGYLKLATISGAPPGTDCDSASEHGRTKVDPNGADPKLYVCTSAGWKTFSTVGGTGTITLIQSAGASRWSNGTYSANCYAYRTNSNYDSIGGGNGLYWVDPNADGANIIKVNCEGMTTGMAQDASMTIDTGVSGISPLAFLETYDTYIQSGEWLKLNGDGFANVVVRKCSSSGPGIYGDTCVGGNVAAAATVAISLGDRASLTAPTSTTRKSITLQVGAQPNFAGGVEYAGDSAGANGKWYHWFYANGLAVAQVTNGMLDESVFGAGTPASPFVMASTTPIASCKAYRTSPYYTSQGTGMYLIDPDGVGGAAAFKAYCDMVTDGGGWTLLFNHTRLTFSAGAVGDSGSYADANGTSLAYSSLPIGTDLMLDGNDAAGITNATSNDRRIFKNIHTGLRGTYLRSAMLGPSEKPIFEGGTTVSTVTDLGQWGSDYVTMGITNRLLCFYDYSDSGLDRLIGDCGHNNYAGWPEDPNYGGPNHWPDNYRIWTR